MHSIIGEADLIDWSARGDEFSLRQDCSQENIMEKWYNTLSPLPAYKRFWRC